MRLPVSIVLTLILLSGLERVYAEPVALDPSISNPHTLTESVETDALEHQSVVTKAKQWGITVTEYQRYQQVINGPLGRWNPNIDPVLALGIYAETPAEEQRYAELYAQQEYELTERTLHFQEAYRTAFHRLYPTASIINRQHLEPYFLHRQSRRSNRSPINLTQRPFMEGDHVLFFPSKSCESCPSIIDTLQRQLAGLKDTAIDIYVLEAANDNDVRQWALKYGIDPKEVQQGQITLNRDNGLLQRLRAQNVRDLAGGLPVFLKRDDQIYQLHPAQLGL